MKKNFEIIKGLGNIGVITNSTYQEEFSVTGYVKCKLCGWDEKREADANIVYSEENYFEEAMKHFMNYHVEYVQLGALAGDNDENY